MMTIDSRPVPILDEQKTISIFVWLRQLPRVYLFCESTTSSSSAFRWTLSRPVCKDCVACKSLSPDFGFLWRARLFVAMLPF